MIHERRHPVGGADYPGTYQELLAWFPDNRACLEYLERLRWPDGFVCPCCGAGACWRTIVTDPHPLHDLQRPGDPGW